jgi:hypothetical protein
MLAGLGPHDVVVAEHLENREPSTPSWLNAVVEHAQAELRLDARARHWFRVFLSSPSREESWAAFRLFLRCVDRRWWLWKNHELYDARNEPDLQVRIRHLVLNRDAIKKCIEKRIDERMKVLFSWRLPTLEMMPWKRSWSL